MGAQERVAQYQLLAEWKAEEQAQWERAAVAKEDDNLALDRYRKQVLTCACFCVQAASLSTARSCSWTFCWRETE